MKIRALCLTLLASACFAPAANAAVAEDWVPYFDASDGVRVSGTGEEQFVRFGPKAAKLFRTLAGRAYTSGCASTTPGEDGTSGMGEGRIPRKRGRVAISGFPGADVCFISARLRASDDSCVLTTTLAVDPGDRPWCARVIVALSDDGRAYLDGFMRATELSEIYFSRSTTLAELRKAYGPDVVALPTADASPPVGKVGFFFDGHTRAVAALLADGTRRFVRTDGDVFSTNVSQLARDPEILTLF